MKKIINKIIVLLIVAVVLFMGFPYEVNASTYNQIIINPNQATNNGIKNFPESYQVLLKKLVEKTGHTNWNFKAFYTNIDWNELVENEHKHLKNTIYKSSTNSYPDSWYCECEQEGDTGFYCASEEILKYYLDPRNFLTEVTIFQFLDLSNSSKISIGEIEKAVDGTFLDGQADGMRYAQMIYDASEQSGESAYSIIIKIFQELGSGEEGVLPYAVSGKDSNYPNVYNFFNYGATDGEENTKRALEFAKEQGWTTPYKAMVGGAKLIGSEYIKQGQNTKYTFKFDIVGNEKSDLYNHQYMTNIEDPNSQAQMLYNKYQKNNYLNDELTFIIPIYKNMPCYNKLPNTENGELYYVSSNYGTVYLRSGPGGAESGYTNIASLKKDTVLTMLQTGINGWAKVSCNGQIGYMSEQYLTKVNAITDIYKIPNQNELPFIDIDANEWYYSAVKYCYNKKIILGTTENTYEPNSNITRGMLVTILWRMENAPVLKTVSKKFPDVASGEWYYNAVNWAASKEIVSGFSDGRFKPNDSITREQLAVIVRNYSLYKGKDITQKANLDKYSDKDKISSWAESAVSWSVATAILSGKNETTLAPKDTATRAEASTILWRYLINSK